MSYLWKWIWDKIRSSQRKDCMFTFMCKYIF